MGTRNEQAWTLNWPIEPGWYWTWERFDDGMPDKMEPAQVIELRGGPLVYGMNGIAIHAADYPRLYWGPRIERPLPPEVSEHAPTGNS